MFHVKQCRAMPRSGLALTLSPPIPELARVRHVQDMQARAIAAHQAGASAPYQCMSLPRHPPPPIPPPVSRRDPAPHMRVGFRNWAEAGDRIGGISPSGYGRVWACPARLREALWASDTQAPGGSRARGGTTSRLYHV